jgi:zinc transport system permease protein
MDFLVLALLAGLGVALVAAPLGAFIVWQRLAYFGDTLAHSALLGVSLGLIFSLNFQFAVILSGITIALLLVYLLNQSQLPSDTILGIISHSTLALGLILVSVFDTGNVDLMSFLLGDILSTTIIDIVVLYSVVIVVGLSIWLFWSQLLSITISDSLAAVDGINVPRIRFLLMILLALTIAVAIKIVGILLMTSMLIIPPAAARFLSRNPAQMVLIAATFGCLSIAGGLAASFQWDTPAGPSIVATSTFIFLVSLLFKRI